MDRIIGIIGFGNMGQAMGEHLKFDYQIVVFDKDNSKLKDLKKITIADNIVNLISQVDTLILAVKPQDFALVLNEIKDQINKKLIISIAAGITTAYVEKYSDRIRVIRVMPNMPAKIGKGMSCLCKGKFASLEDLKFAQELFKRMGETLILKEDMMDAATAVSGSGPGFLYDLSEGKSLEEIKKFTQDVFIPALKESAREIGFRYNDAHILSKATAEGSIAYLEKTKISPGEAKRQVASKGGTTEAGLEILLKGGSLKEAVKAALKRAKELSQG